MSKHIVLKMSAPVEGSGEGFHTRYTQDNLRFKELLDNNDLEQLSGVEKLYTMSCLLVN